MCLLNNVTVHQWSPLFRLNTANGAWRQPSADEFLQLVSQQDYTQECALMPYFLNSANVAYDFARELSSAKLPAQALYIGLKLMCSSK